MMKKILVISFLILLTGGGVIVYKQTRGLRNNNPGNIRLTGDKWQGLRAIQNDLEFFQFTDAKYGIRAIAKLLMNYQEKYNLVTVYKIISRYAPPVENDTMSYVEHVASVVGVSSHQTIDVRDLDTMTKMVNTIIKHENGINPYSEETINKGIALAFA